MAGIIPKTASAVLGVWFGLFGCYGTSAQADDPLFLVDVHERRAIEDPAAARISPALLATRDGGGVLRGSDAMGKAVIAVPMANLPEIQRSKAVRRVSEVVPQDWTPVTRLKLSYKGLERPTNDLLKELGLKLIEDYGNGSFMIVEPVNRRIDSSLVTKLEACEKVRYVTPSFVLRPI